MICVSKMELYIGPGGRFFMPFLNLPRNQLTEMHPLNSKLLTRHPGEGRDPLLRSKSMMTALCADLFNACGALDPGLRRDDE